jgi:hypothetical protein
MRPYVAPLAVKRPHGRGRGMTTPDPRRHLGMAWRRRVTIFWEACRCRTESGGRINRPRAGQRSRAHRPEAETAFMGVQGFIGTSVGIVSYVLLC